VANFHHTRGGLRSSLFFGTAEQVGAAREQRIALDAFVLGGIVLIMIYNLALYFLRRKDSAPLYLALLCALIALWLSLQGALIGYLFVPAGHWGLMVRLEYLTLYLSPVAAGELIRWILPRESRRWLLDIFYVPFGALAATVLLLPTWQFTRTLGMFSALAALFGLMALLTAARAVLRQRSEAALLLTGVAPLSISVAIDAVASFSPQNVNTLTPLGTLSMILMWALLLARRSAHAHALVEQQSKSLSRLNVAYYRFVPREFLHLLGKRDITTVEIGDQVEREMTVLFADVRGFTSLSERMSPQENFAFVNILLGSVGPLIRQHHGFIDKYLGDGIMALFAQEPADAVRAAAGMRAALGTLNQRRLLRGEPAVRIGIGIHTGSIMLGTVGEPARMDGTVISDVVNTSSRLESLTKPYGVTVLLSEAVHATLPPELRESTRVLGHVRAKGKRQPITIHEFFAGDLDEIAELKRSTQADFQIGLAAYRDGEFAVAVATLRGVLLRNPTDGAAQYYLGRAQRQILDGAGADWDGIETLTDK
jgi:class 3 adenylate cyclase